MNAYRIIEVRGVANQTDHVESLIEVRTEQKTAPADVAKHDGDAKPVESTAWSVEPTLPQVWRLAAPWRADVEQRRMALQLDLVRLNLTGEKLKEREALCKVLEDVAAAIDTRVWLVKWWWGTEVERAWTRLHEVEERIIDLLPEGELEARGSTTSAHAGKVLKSEDKQLVAFDSLRADVTAGKAKTTALRPVIVEMLRRVHAQTDRDNHEARYLRNRILIGSSLCVLFSAVMLIAQRRLTALPFLESTDVLAGKPTTYLFVVMMFAAVGALLTAIPTFLQVPSDFSPFNLPLQQGLLKIVSGPVVAVVGFAILRVLNATDVVNSDVVSIGVPSTASAVLVLAVIFGAAQHLVTRYVDRRADEVLSTLAPDKTADA